MSDETSLEELLDELEWTATRSEACITLGLPATAILEGANRLRREADHAHKLRSRQQRVAVEAALGRASTACKQINPKAYPNGVLIFASEDDIAIVHAPRPLRGRIFSCDTKYDTSAIHAALDAERADAYGVIVADGTEASIGKMQGVASGSACDTVAHVRAPKCRAGQSSKQFNSQRDDGEIAFIRKVAENAEMSLSDVCGLVIAGRAEVRRKLKAELPSGLQSCVLLEMELSNGAGSQGLQHTMIRAREELKTLLSSESEQAATAYLDMWNNPSTGEKWCCYGEQHTAMALEMGAVETLLVATLHCGTVAVERLTSRASRHGTTLIEVNPDGGRNAKYFCDNFGIGGTLRWEVDTEMLEAGLQEAGLQEARFNTRVVLEESESEFATPENAAVSGDLCSGEPEEPDGSDEIRIAETMMPPEESASAAALPSDLVRLEVLTWLTGALKKGFEDLSTVEALTACVEVLLTDDAVMEEEALDQAIAMLSGEGAAEELCVGLKDQWAMAKARVES